MSPLGQMESLRKWPFSITPSPVPPSKPIGETRSKSMSKTISKTTGTSLIFPTNNRTSVHWHGILMAENVANDGVPGVTQCMLNPFITISDFRPHPSRWNVHIYMASNILRFILVPQSLLTTILQRSHRPYGYSWS
jgi:hypothetical protein